MGSLWAAGLLLRRLRAELGIVLLTFLLVATTALIAAGAPRLFNRAADDALRQEVGTAPAAQRNVTLSLSSGLLPGVSNGVDHVRAYGEQLAAQIPPSVAALVSDRSLRLTMTRFNVLATLPYDTRVSLRYQDGLTDATRLVAGRWPADLGERLEQVAFSQGFYDTTPPPTQPAVVEAALPADVAAELGIKVGDRLPVSLDGSDPLLGRLAAKLAPTIVAIVGLYQPLDPASDYWSGDAGLREVVFGGTLDSPIAFATAYVAPEAYPSLWSASLPFRYDWTFTVDPARLDADQVSQLRVDVRRLGLITGPGYASPAALQVQTGLPRILDRYAAEVATSQSVLSMAAIGPFALAGGAMTMVALLVLRRRKATLALARSRGASASLVLGTELWEAVVVAGGAAMIGWLAAMLLVPARASPLSPILGVGVGIAATALLVGTTWTAARRSVGGSERDDAPVFRVSPRRLVIEATIVAISVGATFLLRQRGLTIGPAATGSASDPLLAAVPVLSGLAAGIVVARLYPLPIRALGWVAARRRGVVAALGLRTVARQPAAANVSLLVLMLTAAFGAFSSVIASSLEHGQLVASYLTVGADYSVMEVGPGPLPTSLDPAAIAGVTAVAHGQVDPSAPFESVPGQPAHVYVAAIDPRAYEAVVGGTPADPRWPSAFGPPPAGVSVGTDADPIPAILSSMLPMGGRTLAPGDTFRLTVASEPMTFRLVESRDTFPGIAAQYFAIVPFDWVQAGIGHSLTGSAAWLRGSADVGAGLAAALGNAPLVRVTSRYDAYAALHDTPLEELIGNGFLLALVVAALYMAVTIIGAMILSAARRTRDLAYLRTLGVSAPQALGLTVVEHATPVLLAIIPGTALGIGVAMLCEPGLGLATFVGTTGVPLYVDWASQLLVLAALVSVVVLAVVAGTWLARRARLADALRIDER